MQNFLDKNIWILLLAIAWSLPWKGLALWRTAKKDDKIWFVIFMLVNTLGILEILYIFAFSKEKDS